MILFAEATTWPDVVKWGITCLMLVAIVYFLFGRSNRT